MLGGAKFYDEGEDRYAVVGQFDLDRVRFKDRSNVVARFDCVCRHLLEWDVTLWRARFLLNLARVGVN